MTNLKEWRWDEIRLGAALGRRRPGTVLAKTVFGIAVGVVERDIDRSLARK